MPVPMGRARTNLRRRFAGFQGSTGPSTLRGRPQFRGPASPAAMPHRLLRSSTGPPARPIAGRAARRPLGRRMPAATEWGCRRLVWMTTAMRDFYRYSMLRLEVFLVRSPTVCDCQSWFAARARCRVRRTSPHPQGRVLTSIPCQPKLVEFRMYHRRPSTDSRCWEDQCLLVATLVPRQLQQRSSSIAGQ